jgi:predicted amidohydrolase YtcJ
MLKPGYFADVTILDSDIEAVAAEDIHAIRPAAVICGGRVTYEA